jgi:N-methylhydantoinase A
VSGPLGLSDIAAARAIVEIAVLNMSLAVRQVSVERGYDPRDFALLAFGGAGPLHGAAVARALHIPTMIVPVFPGQFSAAGMLAADWRHDFVRTCYQSLERADFAELTRIADELSADARNRLRAERSADADADLRYTLEMRYAGQDFSMPVSIATGLLARGDRDAVANAFNAGHQRAFGYHDPAQPLEIVSVRLAAIARRGRPGSLHDAHAGRPEGQGNECAGNRPVWFGGDRPVDCPVYPRERLRAGERVDGPAIVQEYASTTLVGPRDRLEVAQTGELVIAVGPA